MPRDIARATRATLLALLLLAVAGCTRRVAPGRVPPPLPPGQLALAHACGAPGRDTDGDALADACELALARAMAPLLVVGARGCVAAARLTLVLPSASPTAEECTWDPARPFLGWQARPDGEPASSHARYLALLGFA